jgi:hypothetical protein
MFNIKKTRIMKTFRMMLPVMAVIFAVVGAVGGDLLPIANGYYKVSEVACSTVQPLDQSTCIRSDNAVLPICTITPSGGSVQQAFQNSNCSGVLRYE